MKTFLKVLAIVVGCFVLVSAIVSRVETPPTVEDLARAQQHEQDVKSRAQSIAYAALSRNPDSYKGKAVLFRGQVVQALESGRSVALRVNVTQDQYHWKDTVYVDYRKKAPDETRILENDIVTLWGEYKGIKSYEAIFGNTVQIPHVVAVSVQNFGKR
jgi:hypothetical protein